MANRKIADRSAQAEGTWYDTLPRSTKLPTVAGALIMAVVLMGFGVWGNMAPIAGAVVASGVFVVTGQNKIIQHLEGGMIREIYVREGDKVEAGQVLLELDDTAARAELQPGDVIVAVKGETITSQREFYRKLWALGPAGVDVPLTLHRGGDTFNVVLTSTDRTRLQKKPRLH